MRYEVAIDTKTARFEYLGGGNNAVVVNVSVYDNEEHTMWWLYASIFEAYCNFYVAKPFQTENLEDDDAKLLVYYTLEELQELFTSHRDFMAVSALAKTAWRLFDLADGMLQCLGADTSDKLI